MLGVRDDDADQPPALVVEDLPGSATSAVQDRHRGAMRRSGSCGGNGLAGDMSSGVVSAVLLAMQKVVGSSPSSALRSSPATSELLLVWRGLASGVSVLWLKGLAAVGGGAWDSER